MPVGMTAAKYRPIPRSTSGGPLDGLKAGFAAELERQGYSPATADPYLRRFGNLNGWMARHGLGVEDLSPAMVEQFCAACRAASYHHYTSIRGVKPLLAFLRSTGLCGEEPVSPSPVDVLLARFAGWLERERHLASSSVETYMWHVRPLVERLAIDDRVELERLDVAFVRRFVVEVCPRQGRASAKLTVVALRHSRIAPTPIARAGGCEVMNTARHSGTRGRPSLTYARAHPPEPRPPSTFCLLRAHAGIEPRFGCQPTLHGLRHTFAIRTMLDAYQQGHDAGARLGVLATVLGHVAPAHTYWYLQAVPELMRAAADRLEQH